ncbi:MAG TPA: helix-turn-helix transcriptional regulator [Conexibacter sp.]|jgi:DNA-binding CsgD family transcriptional regulator
MHRFGINHRRAAIAHEAVARLALSSLDGVELLLEIADLVMPVVPFESAGLVLLDPETFLMAGGETLGPIGRHVPLMLRNELLSSDVHKLRELAQRELPIATMSSLGALAWESSERRVEILDRIGVGDELRVVLRHNRSSWGFACMSRASDTNAFDADEVLFMRQIAAAAAPALQRSLTRRTTVESAATPGVMLVNSDLQIASMSASAERWQRLMPAYAAMAVQSVAVRAQDPAADESSRRIRVRLTNGEWLTMHSAPLDDVPGRSGLTVVTLTLTEGSDLAQLMMRVYGLSRREREVVGLLLGGLSNDVIAKRLSIVRHTLLDHQKSIFGKVGVNTRAELTVALAGRTPAASPAGFGSS